MNSADSTTSPATQMPSPARKATGFLLAPYFIGALAIHYALPLNWNAFGAKFVLILVLPVLAMKKVPMSQVSSDDKWQWPHFFATILYLVLASWLMFHKRVLVGCYWEVCF